MMIKKGAAAEWFSTATLKVKIEVKGSTAA